MGKYFLIMLVCPDIGYDYCYVPGDCSDTSDLLPKSRSNGSHLATGWKTLDTPHGLVPTADATHYKGCRINIGGIRTLAPVGFLDIRSVPKKVVDILLNK